MKESITLKIKPDFKKYYNVNRLFSYDASFYFIIGGRGIGKTTGFNIHDVIDYKHNGNEFVYARRYQPELKKCKSMLNPVVNNKVTIEGYGDGAYEYRINGARVGYGVALSSQQSLKSGMDFTKVNTMVFDEAILPLGGSFHYLENEVEMFLELVSTVFRDRVGYRVFVLGNNANIFNIYFDYFKIPPFESSYYDRNRGIYAEMAKNSAQLLEAEKKTPLFKLTDGTAYGDYHYNNKVLVTTSGTIAVKPDYAKVIARILVKTYTLNVYAIGKGLTMFIEFRDRQINDNITFKLYDENGNPNLYYIREFKQTALGKLILERYYMNDVAFDCEKAVEIFCEFVSKVRL